MPKVSVIIPVFNRTVQFQRAVESVLQQTFQDLELIIVDDGSTQNIKAFIPADPRILFIKHKNQGVSAARNTGILLAEGEFIAFLDSDDTWEPNKLEKQVGFMESHPEYLISQCEEIWVRDGNRVNAHKKHQKKEGNIFADSLQLCLISPSAVIMRKELFALVGCFDSTLPACEDYDLWLRVTARYPVGLLPELLMTRYAGHADQLSQKYPFMDLFRVKSLKTILKTGVLTPEQQKQANAVYLAKKAILVNGAWKRSRFFAWIYYKYFML